MTIEPTANAVDAPVWNIVGETVALGPMRRELLPLYHRWRNDFWVQRTYGDSMIPASLEQQTIWF